MKMNQKGFGVVEGLLAVIALTLIVGVGFYVVDTNKDNQLQSTQPTQIEQSAKPSVTDKVIPKDWDKFEQQGFSFYAPSSWKAAGEQNTGADAQYKDGTKTLTAKVYKTYQPRLYYSSNAPFYCQLDSGTWNNYRYDVEKPGVQQNDQGSCSRVINEVNNGRRVSYVDGGALGRVKYDFSIELTGFYVVVSDYRDFTDTTETGTIENDELLAATQTFIKEFTRVNSKR